jgi:hypothetical protein
LVGAAALIASGFGTFYSILAVGVSDGLGHVSSQLMLGGCILAALCSLMLIWRAALSLLARL